MLTSGNTSWCRFAAAAAVAVRLAAFDLAGTAAAQAGAVIVEADLTAGHATEDSVSGAALQFRAFGEAPAETRFTVEGTWGQRSDDTTDAFGSADSYSGRIRLSEAYAERVFHRGSRLVALRLGRYRSPFGISNRSDHAYSGFLRAPLVRYDGYWAVTNGFREQGADIAVGIPHLSLEASVGVPGDVGIVSRRSGLEAVARVQGDVKSLIVGLSHINSKPYVPEEVAPGRLDFTGVDARWMAGGIQLRGEWMVGRPWRGPKTRGGYVDATVHRPFMGPVTAVVRSEWLTYNSDVPFAWHGEGAYVDWHGQRQTLGGRVRLPAGFTAQMDVIRNSRAVANPARTSLDVAVTYSIRRR